MSWCTGRLELPLECTDDGVITNGASSPRFGSTIAMDGAKKGGKKGRSGGKEEREGKSGKGRSLEEEWVERWKFTGFRGKGRGTLLTSLVGRAIRQPNLGV